MQDAEEESDGRSDFNDEAIVVTRQEEAVDPEEEADFEREYAKMMSESLDSRKFERKQLFDVPLPVRAKAREASTASPTLPAESSEPILERSPPTGSNTMAFSLLTKRGNRQQVCFLMMHMGAI